MTVREAIKLLTESGGAEDLVNLLSKTNLDWPVAICKCPDGSEELRVFPPISKNIKLPPIQLDWSRN